MILHERTKNDGPDMMSMKIPGLVLLALLFLIPWCSAGSVPAQSITALPAQPYITINPVGDHTVDEVFYITGTTNLAVANDSLYLQIESANANPGGIGSFFWSNVSIQPGKNGISIWSVNSTASQWETYALRSPPSSQGAVPGKYTVMVVSLNPNITAKSTQQFFLVPSGNEPTSPQDFTTNMISENNSQETKTTEKNKGIAPISLTTSTYGNWTEITSNATFESRNYFGTVTFDDRLWVIGGREENFMNDVWSSPDGNTWSLETAHANFSPRVKMGVTEFDNRIWVIGGAGENYQLMNDVWSSTDGKNWELVTANASFDPRHSPGVVVFNNRLWVIGGNQNNDVWSSADGKNWELATANVSFGLRLGEGVAAFDNRLWVIGGDRNNDIWSSTDGKIRTLVNASAPFQQMEFTPVTVFGDKLWIVGGGSNGPTHETKNPSVFPAYEFNEIWSSADGKIWTLETEHAGFSPRSEHGLAVFRNGIWVIGGSNSSGNDIWYMSGSQLQDPLTTALTTIPTTSRTSPPPIIAWIIPKEELSKKISTVHFSPSKNFTGYSDAPSITGIQKIDALMIASTSTRDSHLSSAANAGAIHKKFGDYLKSSHGPITIEWAYPYTGIIRLSMPVGNLSSNEYGLAYAIVNIDTQSILSEGFVDWHNYW
ncbi:hypothetical protein [Methanoregula sp. UBA64]|jgi:hypothetical protein|uniref:hypothetical protein n=1 Tax=Methanoregula sp. UBA64 TaxID=1915554 RepID=UPI0025E6738E|nr:hypothetical protein [Methanoregula sp. UBA64]